MMSNLLIAGCVVALGAIGAHRSTAPPFELPAAYDRTFGHTDGTLIVAADGVTFRASNSRDTRKWAYADLKQVAVVSPTRIELSMYEDRDPLHFATDRVYPFDLRQTVTGELVAYLANQLGRPLVTAVLPTLPPEPAFRVSAKRTYRGWGSQGELRLYEAGLVFVSDRYRDQRFWRFQDIFAVLPLDPFRLQVTAYEGGSGATRPYIFDLKASLPSGMYDALWNCVNQQTTNQRSTAPEGDARSTDPSFGTARTSANERREAGRSLQTCDVEKPMTMNSLTLAGALAFSVVTGPGAAAVPDPQHQQMAMTAPADPMAQFHKLFTDSQANTAKLDALLEKANSANGPAKMAALTDVVSALIEDRKATLAAMSALHQALMPVAGKTEMTGMSGMHHEMMSAAETPTSTTAPEAIDIAFRTKPEQPQMGDNALEVTLKDNKGLPITDATVTVTFYMPPMPSMNMPAMKSSATLKHDAGGVYRGTGQITMSGRWEVTVSATKDAKDLASKKVTVTAR